MKIKEINIFTENIYPDWEVDELKVICVGRKIVKYFLKHLLEKSCLNGYDFDTLTFDILFCDSKKTHQINKEYRDKDAPTDVISFALEDDKTVIEPDGVRILGDIYISIDKVHEQALEYGHSFKRELSFLAVHGLLHLLGYDHMEKSDEEVMFKKQEEVLNYYEIYK